MKKRSTTQNVLYQGSILAMAAFISRFIGLLYRIPVNNIITDAGVADYSNAYVIYNIVLILSSVSLPTAISKTIGKEIGANNYKNIYRIISVSFFIALTVGLFSSSILFFFANDIATKIFKLETSALPLKILAPTVFISAMIGVMRGYFQGHGNMVVTAKSQIIEQIINAVVSVYAATYFMKLYNMPSYGAAGSTLGTTLGAFVALIYMFIMFNLKRYEEDSDSGKVYPYKYIFYILIITIFPIILSQIINQITSVLDQAIFLNILESKNYTLDERRNLLGIYTGKYLLISSLPIAISTSLSASSIALFSKLYVSNKKDLPRKFTATMKFNMMLVIPCFFGLLVLSKPVLMLLFRDSRDLSANILGYGSLSIVFYAISNMQNGLLQSVDKMGIPIRNALISLVVHVIIVIICLQYLDLELYSLIIGNITFPLVTVILNSISIKKYLRFKLKIFNVYIIPIISSVVMAIITFLSYKITYNVTHINVISVVFSIICSILVYFPIYSKLYELVRGKRK